jgi:diadenosine tetraphosphatase ApaH/serine/threonine PP2A family protein phosphatase
MLAALYDVHGNLPALEAVVADARARGADRWLLGGDYALFGAWPAETVALLEELAPASWLRGNGERWTAEPLDAPGTETVQGAIHACRDALGAVYVRRLGDLPFAHEEPGLHAVHASPVSDVRSFPPEPEADEAELLAGRRDGRLVFGHTHLPFLRRAAGADVELLNPGSVGMPFDGDPRASYALLHDDGRVDARRVAYDHASSARAVRERFHDAPWTRVVAARIERARMDVD